MNRVFTADGPGVVTETDTRHGVTWFHIEGAAMSGWYTSREVTADIGDPGRTVTDPGDFPGREHGTRLPYDPAPRDRFRDQLTIQPIADLPENLEPTDSIKGLRQYEPNAVFGSTDTGLHPFGKVRNARHFADHDTDTSDDEDPEPYDHADDPGKNPGLDDYGKDYDKKNPLSINPDGDGPFDKTSEDLTPRTDNYYWVKDSTGNYWTDTADYNKACSVADQLAQSQGQPFTVESTQGVMYRTADINRDLGDDWNHKATPEEIDHSFTRDDIDDDPDIEQTDLHEHTAAGLNMLSDPDEDQMTSPDSLGNAVPNFPGQVPADPSHGMTPDNQMQVYSPNNDNDMAGALQQFGEGLEGNGDDIQGIPVPHQPDVDDELQGIPVPHQGPAQLGPADGFGQSGNMTDNPRGTMSSFSDEMAENFLRTAGKNYSEGEQHFLMNESGEASQLPSLNLVGSIYEDDENTFLGM